jgi:solute carrier family 25 (mitochondrial phosphate transporter), member 3
MAISSIEVSRSGSGYAVEKPLNVYLVKQSNSTGKDNSQQRILIGTSYPKAEKTSFTSFRSDSDKKQILDLEEKVYNIPSSAISGSADEGATTTLPFWTPGRSSSAELLRMLPAGVGLEFDSQLKRYSLAIDTTYMDQFPNTMIQSSSNYGRPIGPEFGPRGRAPIERDMELDASMYLRFCASGAICSSAVHLLLTPIDVIKTKVQTNPILYPTIGASFAKVFQEEGVQTFYTGWLPTVLSNFVGGGVLYALVEFVRRTLSEAAAGDAIRLEVPIILFSAGFAAAVAAVFNCPFEAIRIRTVAQPNYAPNSIEVFKRIVREEGVASLFDAVPPFLIRNVPYAATKFLVFDVSTEKMYAMFPAAQEELKLSLLVSLIGGILGGTSAACVSNPADAVISELKKTKSDISPQQALGNLLQRGGVASLFKGLPLRIVFYSLIGSLTFVIYDAVRFALGIGPDDLKLYLDVLGGALRE